MAEKWIVGGGVTGPAAADALPLLSRDGKHTSGRWLGISAPGPMPALIALVPPGKEDHAHLIAAAPELYDMLQLMLVHGKHCNWFADRGDYELVEEAETILKAARGEP